MATNTYVLWTEYGKEEHIKDVLTNTILRDHQEHTTLYVPKKIKLLRGSRRTGGTNGLNGSNGSNGAVNGWTETVDILFPNYVFIDTDAEVSGAGNQEIREEYQECRGGAKTQPRHIFLSIFI